MSRVGKVPVPVPTGVTVNIDASGITVSGPKGNLSQSHLSGVDVKQEDNLLVVTPKDNQRVSRANYGLMRALLNNMVNGVTKGFERKLEINGVGYRVALSGSDLRFSLGYSHPSVYKLPAGVTAKIEQNIITISGNSRQQVGQVAAEIRALRKPEPYKGKGIKFVEERIIRKSGKSGKEKA